MKRSDQFRVLAVIRPRSEGGELDGGSSTVDRRLVEAAGCRPEGPGGEKKRRGEAK